MAPDVVVSGHMRIEMRHGLAVIEEGRAGAQRFAGGEGRGGAGV